MAQTRQALNSYNFTSTATGPLAMSTIANEIGTYRRPFIAAWGWTGGGGHMVVMNGYDIADGGFVTYMNVAYGSYYTEAYSYFKSNPTRTWYESLYQVRKF